MKLNMPNYPMLTVLARYGDWFAVIVALLAFAWGVARSVSTGGAGYAVAGLVGGILVYIVTRAMVEMVRLITDMLLPK